MYPAKSQTSSQRSSTNKANAREQLAELLSNKFRNRYTINVQNECDLDTCIHKEIQKVVHQEASVSERDLNELDKRINSIVSSMRKGQAPPRSQAASDAKSIYSSVAKRSVARSKTESNDFFAVDPDQQIITANHGKVIGMTSAEWNNQVQNNVHQWMASNQEKQRLVQAQRDQMRTELQMQMAIKADRERAIKDVERHKHQQQLAVIERKLVKDEIEAQMHEDKIRRNISMPVQYDTVNNLKCEDQQRIRYEENEKRRMLDDGIRRANMADANMEQQKRAQLKVMAEEDRKNKQYQKLITEAKDQGRSFNEVTAHVFSPNTSERKTSKHMSLVNSPPLKSAGAAIMLK